MRTVVKIAITLALVAMVGTVAFYSMNVDQSLAAIKRHSLEKNNLKSKTHDVPLEEKHDDHHTCGHAKALEWVQPDLGDDQEVKRPLPSHLDPNYEEYLLANYGSGNWQNIRLKADYSNLDRANVEQDLKNKVKNELVKAAFAYLSKALRVSPMTSNIQIHPHYRTNQCSKATVPRGDVDNGVANADMVFYIFGEDDGNQDFVAYAGSCDQGGFNLENKRPTVGFIAVNFYYLRDAVKNNRYGLWVNTLIHEVSHALGFSSSAFPKYVKYSEPVYYQSGGRYFINAPNVLQYAREYFNCDSIRGLPLEDNGSQGSAGSHWERVSFGNEYMTASEMERTVVSKFSLLLLEASGWYMPNFDEAQEFEWGKGEGCKFVQGSSCITGSEEFCSSNQINADLECNWDFGGVGRCRSDDQFAPNCGYWRDDLDCAYQTNFQNVWKAAGGTGGPSSKCWETDRVKAAGYNSSGRNIMASCYVSWCDFAKKETWVVYSGKWYQCAQGQAQIDLPNGGYIKCPHYGRFCLGVNSCPNQCSQRGTCRSGQCVCYQGYQGNDCSQTY